MPAAECSRQHDVTADSSKSPTKTGGAPQSSGVAQNNQSGGTENIPLTQESSQPDYDNSQNESQSAGDLGRKSVSPKHKSSPSKSADSRQGSGKRHGKDENKKVNGEVKDSWVYEQKGDGDTVYTVRNESEIVNINTTDQASIGGKSESKTEEEEEEEEEEESEEEESEEEEGDTESEEEDDSDEESESESEEEREEKEETKEPEENKNKSNMEQTETETIPQNGEKEFPDRDARSPNDDVPQNKEYQDANRSPEHKPKPSPGPSQNTLDLNRAAASVHDMYGNVQDLFVRVRAILTDYHTELSGKTLKDFVLDKEDFHDNFVAISNIYSECETMTSSINKQLKDLRLITTEMYRLINRKFREEDLATWIDHVEDEDKTERLLEERIAQEKAVLAKAAEARSAFAKASTGVSETHEVVAQVEAEAAEAEITAKKAHAAAIDAIKTAEDARRAAEEKRKVEEEARKKAEERARIKAEQKRKKREEEEKMLEEEAKKKGTSFDEEKQKYMDEMAAREAERKNPKNWPRYIYSCEGGSFDPGVGCIIRAIDGSLSRDDVEVKRLDQLTGVLSLYENEELISNIVHVQPVDKEKSFNFEEPVSLAIPHCAPRSGIGREPIVKMLLPSGRWIDLQTNDVFFDDIKELRFVEARVKKFGTFAVIYRIKKDTLTFLKRGGIVTSSVDSRVTFISKPQGFKFNTSFTLEVQSVDLSLVSDLRMRKPECSQLLASSPIIKMNIANKKFPRPITVTLPVPPNPSRLKRPVTSVNRDPATPKQDLRPATAKPSSTYTKKEEETSVDDIHLVQRLPDGTWVKVTDVVLVQAKNKDIVTFDMTRSYERFFIMRTKLDLSTPQVEQIATTLTETIPQRKIQFYLRQNNENMNAVAISCATVSKLDRILRKLAEEGFEEGPPLSREIFVREGQVVDLKFRGNLKPENDEYTKQFLFNSHIPCRVDFNIQIVDTFAQKCLFNYRGFAQLFTEGLVPRTLPPSEDSRESKRGTQQKAQPRVVMEIGEVLIAELLMTLPKPEPEPPKPLITAPINITSEGPIDKEVLRHISRELGDEWKRLAIHLNVKRTRIQAILRQNISNDNSLKIYDMLTTWSKRLPRAVDRVEILAQALSCCGRVDLARELKERREEFRRQRSISARSSYMHKAFVKVARDQSVISDWKHLGRKLGLSEADMADIERERPTSQDRCLSSLERWRERNGEDATITTLSKKLRGCSYKLLARDIESIG